jgi:hypothetical protein
VTTASTGIVAIIITVIIAVDAMGLKMKTNLRWLKPKTILRMTQEGFHIHKQWRDFQAKLIKKHKCTTPNVGGPKWHSNWMVYYANINHLVIKQFPQLTTKKRKK